MPRRQIQAASPGTPGATPASHDVAEQLVPMVREIHAAVGDLRSRLDVAVADLRAQISGKNQGFLHRRRGRRADRACGLHGS